VFAKVPALFDRPVPSVTAAALTLVATVNAAVPVPLPTCE
jgi:hypothetical protein